MCVKWDTVNMYITVWAQEIKLQQKQNSLQSDPLVLATNPERASIMISALGWAHMQELKSQLMNSTQTMKFRV